MEKKIAIALTTLMVAVLATSTVLTEYTATAQGENITVVVGPGGVAFGSLAKGNTSTLTSSLNLSNIGSTNISVTAKFTTNVSTAYGLVSGASVLPATNFLLGTTGNLVALNNAGTDAALGVANNVPAGNWVLYDARLTVPVAQTAGSYNGTVQLTFANAP